MDRELEKDISELSVEGFLCCGCVLSSSKDSQEMGRTFVS